MKRAIVTPPIPGVDALNELKAWLAITTTGDDAALAAALSSAAELFEGFTGQMPLACACTQILPASGAWQRIGARPVQAITRVDGLSGRGDPVVLGPAAYAMELDADGGGRVRILEAEGIQRLVVHFIAGMAQEWAQLPPSIRHGIVRLAAHAFRQRDGDAPGPVPPASIAALWRPWRQARLA